MTNTTPQPMPSVEEVVKALMLKIGAFDLDHSSHYNIVEKILTTTFTKERAAHKEAMGEMVERIKDALPMKQREKCDDEDNCGLCLRGLERKCHVQEISRVINEIRDDVLEAIARYRGVLEDTKN